MVVRPDLSGRTGLSKSALTTFAMCAQKSFQRKYYPRPFIKIERVTFGSCVDAGVESLIVNVRDGKEPDIARAMEESRAIEERDGIAIDQAEVETALGAFVADVMPRFDWANCWTQAAIHLPLFGWGEVDGHPDIIFGSNAVFDVKTAKDPKPSAKTVELGMYALLVEAHTGEPVPEVGYLVWVRDGQYWQGFGSDAIGERELKSGPRKGQMVKTGHYMPFAYVDDEFRRWTQETVSTYVRADRLDDLVNKRRRAKGLEPENHTFASGPVRWSICKSCEYAPQLGGACRLAPLGDVDDD